MINHIEPISNEYEGEIIANEEVGKLSRLSFFVYKGLEADGNAGMGLSTKPGAS